MAEFAATKTLQDTASVPQPMQETDTPPPLVRDWSDLGRLIQRRALARSVADWLAERAGGTQQEGDRS